MITFYLSFDFLMKPLLKIFIIPVLFLANCFLLIPLLLFTTLLLFRANRKELHFIYDDEVDAYAA